MKVNIFLIMISGLLALLVGYLMYNIAQDKDHGAFYGTGTFMCLFVTLVPAIGLQYENGRLGTNIRAFSSLFFIAFLINNFCFTSFGINMPYYIIVNGIILVIYLAILYKIQNIKSI